MTLIEFFDKTPIDNIAAALALRPKRIVFIGSDRKKISSVLPHIRWILTEHGIKTALTMRLIPRNDLSGILGVLREVLVKEDEYVFDFTGGDDTALVALGMVFRSHGRNTSFFRMECDTRQGMLYRLPKDTGGEFSLVPFDGTDKENGVALSVAENIRLHKGQIKTEMLSANTASGYIFSPETQKTLSRLWKICRTDCAFWNSQIGKLGAVLRPTADSKLVYTLSPSLRGIDEGFLASLTDGKFLKLDTQKQNGLWHCEFSDPYVKDCLTKAGTLLEYKTYMTAMYCPVNNTPSPYTDGAAGVVIDWSDTEKERLNRPKRAAHSQFRTPASTRNEMDTILMQGLIPVFISCKNGEIDTDELYKLSTVAGRFGNRYARRALVATSFFDKEDRGYAGDSTVSYLRSRAQDMQISIIENVHRMSDAEFARALRKIAVSR